MSILRWTYCSTRCGRDIRLKDDKLNSFIREICGETMTNAPKPSNEKSRLEALRSYKVLETPPEASFDRITALAARLFGVPIALISFVDERRAWFKSSYGFENTEISRDATICSFAILTPTVLVVPDTREDPRFAYKPFALSEPGIRFYAAAPLVTHDGFNLGTLCLVDSQPRQDLTVEQRATLYDLAAIVVDELELRLAARQVSLAEVQLKQNQQVLLERSRLADLIKDVSLSLNQSYSLQEMLSECTEAVVRHLGAAFARIWTLNQAANTLELQASSGLYTHIDGPHSCITVGQFKIGRIAQNRKPHLTNQVVGDGEIHDQEWAKQSGMVAFAGYPLVVEDQLMGVLAMFSRAPLAETTLQALDSVANGIALGIQRHRIEEERQKLALVIENSPDFIGITTWEGQILFINESGQKLVGLDGDEAVKPRPVSEYFTSEDLAYFQEQIIPAMNELGQWVGEFRFRHLKTGMAIPVYSNIFAIKDPKTGRPIGIATVSQDITARKQAEIERAQLFVSEQAARAEAEAANTSKDEFIAVLSHELRTPLNAMLGWSRLLLKQRQNEIIVTRGLETIKRNAEMQSQLIEDLLDVTRIVQGKIRLQLLPIDLPPVIQAAIDDLQLAADAKQIRLESIIAPCLGKVLADPNRLQQIVCNLLSNAIKFTPEGGRVEVLLTYSPSQATILVIDTGKGIEPEFLPYIFDRFRQAEDASSKTKAGLGLGLAIVHHLVKLHGGTITAVCEGKNQGTTFTLMLPLITTLDATVAPGDSVIAGL